MTSEFEFQEHHMLFDVKLFLEIACVVVASVTCAYCYFVPFPACKQAQWIGVVLWVKIILPYIWCLQCTRRYVFLSVVLGLFSQVLEKDTFFVGTRKDPVGAVRSRHRLFAFFLTFIASEGTN